ncbi:MAG: hypothetical protein MUC36_14055 [Planctomycetes bacterium]|nr:hypothetical protein [Planctomycetota bacterium]
MPSSPAAALRSPGDQAWSLPVYLLLALALRLPAVLFAHGFEFVDQQYQYVDPAWHLASGAPFHRTWEWLDGVRSQVYPHALAGLFRAVTALGVDDPLWVLTWVRFANAVGSLLPLWACWLLVVRWRPLARPRPALLLIALSGLTVHGVQPSGPALASTLAVTAAVLLAGPGRWPPLLAGLCLGFAFCGRFQDALFGPAFLGVLLWQRRGAAAAWFAAGCAPGIAVQGLVDLHTTGTFLLVPWRYLQTNLGLGAAEKWRTQPWWFYLLAGAVPTAMLVPGLLRPAWRRLCSGGAVVPTALAGAMLHLGLHSGVARKALRFEYPALAMLLVVVAVGLPAAVGRAAHWHARLLWLLHGLLWAWTSLWFGNAGAVHTALWLSQQPGFAGRVLVVGGDPTSLGGYFHLRPPVDGAAGVGRGDFAAFWARHRDDFDHVVAVREPLGAEATSSSATDGVAPDLELVVAFTGQFDLRRGDRRFVYRRRGLPR